MNGIVISGLRRGTLLTLGLVILCTATGCGAKTVCLSGKVTYVGKPLTSGSSIVYCPDKQIVRGIISRDGTYTIQNVPRGLVTVTVRSHPRVPVGLQVKQQLPPTRDGPILAFQDGRTEEALVVIPERYGLPEESGLTIQVDRDRMPYDIELRP